MVYEMCRTEEANLSTAISIHFNLHVNRNDADCAVDLELRGLNEIIVTK